MYINANEYKLQDKIFRVTTLDFVLDLFVQKRLTLVKPILWDDPLENLLWKQKYSTLDGSTVEFKSLREGVFGQCWTFNDEKDFSWKVYAPGKNGLKLQTTIKKLHDEINKNLLVGDEFYVKKVNYIDLRSAIEKWNTQVFYRDAFKNFGMDMLFYKDIPFDHEKEFRAIYITNSIDKQRNSKIYFQVDPNNLIDKITIDSRLDQDGFDSISKILRQCGYMGEIEHSNLYKHPKVTFTIK